MNEKEKTTSQIRRSLIQAGCLVATLDTLKITSWAKPAINSVVLPAHAQTSTNACPTATSSDVIVTAGNIQIYREGEGGGIWWSTIGPVPSGYVAFNLLPTVLGTLPLDTIFWEVSFDVGVSFSDISSVGITNGQTTIDQETSGDQGSTPAIPDTENQTDLIFRVTINRPECMDDIRRSVTFNIVATDIFITQSNALAPQFARSWEISYTSLDANLDPMGSPISLPILTA